MRYKRFIVGQNTKIQVMQQITFFFTIFCSFFVAITSVESCPGKWIQVQSLVLSEGDQYNIHYLNFDINQSYLINKDIIEDMEHDPRILTPSLAVLSQVLGVIAQTINIYMMKTLSLQLVDLW